VNSPLRILYLEDDPRDAELVLAQLEADGFASHLTRVENQIDFCASLEQGGFDLILADYTLPSFNGISALKIAVEKRPDVPFIFVSGTLDEEIAIEALKIGATDYVFKTRLSRIVPALQRALREGQARAERKLTQKALRRSEAYLAEAQRLSHTGSFGWILSTGELFWSDETFRIFQYDRTTTPTVELALRRTHPEDVAFVSRTIEHASRDRKDFDFEHRLLMPDGSVKHVRIVARVLSGESEGIEFVGAVMDITSAKESEATLRRSEGYLAEAQRLSHTGSWARDAVTDEMRYSSEEFYRVLGFDPHDGPPVFETFLQRVHPDDQAEVREIVENARIEKAEYEMEYRIIHPSGEIREMHVIAHPVLSPSGDLLEFIGTVMDVTERRRAEESLRRSEGYLAEAQRLSHTGSWAWIPATGEIKYMSEECYRVLGFDPHGGQARDEMFFQSMHSDDQGRVREAVKTAGRTKAEFELDHRIIHLGGEIRDIHVVGHPVLSPSGDLVEFVGTVMDVTERKRAEGALRRSEAYLAEAQKLSHTGSWAYNIDTKELIHSSEEHRRLFGFDPERGVPSFEELVQRIHPEDRVPAMQDFENPSRARTDFDAHFRIVHPDGTTKFVYGTGHPVFNASGDVGEFVGSVMDVTARKRAEEERERLRQAQADLAHVNRVTTMGELTASLAHEVNQPIAAAVTNANTCVRWLTRDRPDLEEAREAATRIVKDGTRAAEIIKRIRLLFQKGTPERELVDVNEVIREMIVLLDGEAARYAVSVRAELAADLPQVMGDRVQLQQVFMNLMLNSIEAMKDVDTTRELAVKSQPAENERILLSVSDTGVGLPPQYADQIFNAFFTTKGQGTGMGLSISRTIVESHGGDLWATENPGRGATFHLTLPRGA
jgi:PAS domain S-box-containing protein